MSRDPHYVGLERMYARAPVNATYRPALEIHEGRARIEIEVHEGLHHAAGAVHGSVYFKMLDDAAYFAANSVERETYLLTGSFTTYFLRPVSAGTLRAEGRLVHRGRARYLAEATLVDGEGRDVARGSGVFLSSGEPLSSVPGYAD